jgi:uncharacterized protein (DUF433 family)
MEGTAMSLTLTPTAPPLRIEESGAVRVGDTRVLLELVIWTYQRGESAEDIAKAYPTLLLSDVHAVIAYYLRNKQEVDEYLAQVKRDSEEMRRRVEALQDDKHKELRERIRARREAGS